MAPVIFGFDLSEMHWRAFTHKEMFTRKWHLRRERFVVYQIAMLVCLAAECCATYSLAKYDDLQTNIHELSGNIATLHKGDLYAAECLTIVFCVLVATLFGADFFFLLFFPKRRYPRWYNAIKKGCAIFITGGVLAAAIMSTVVVASHTAFIKHATPEEAAALTQHYFRPPLKYHTWPTNIAYVVLLWVGWVATLASTIIMLIAVDHDEAYGPEEGYRIDSAMAERRR